MRALPDLMLAKALGCGEGAAGGAFCVPVGAGAWVPGVCRWRCRCGAVFLVLDGAFFEGQANGVNAIAKISGRIETFAREHVA